MALPCKGRRKFIYLCKRQEAQKRPRRKWAGVSNAEKFHSCAATAMPIWAPDEYGVFHCGCKCGIIHTSPAPGTRLCGVGLGYPHRNGRVAAFPFRWRFFTPGPPGPAIQCFPNAYFAWLFLLRLNTKNSAGCTHTSHGVHFCIPYKTNRYTAALRPYRCRALRAP